MMDVSQGTKEIRNALMPVVHLLTIYAVEEVGIVLRITGAGGLIVKLPEPLTFSSLVSTDLQSLLTPFMRLLAGDSVEVDILCNVRTPTGVVVIHRTETRPTLGDALDVAVQSIVHFASLHGDNEGDERVWLLCP